MTTQDMPAHSFLPISNMKNENVSKLLGTNFCAAYNRSGLGNAQFIECETNDVDFIANIDGRLVAIELVSYRQIDEHIFTDNDETKLKHALSEALAASDLPTIQPFLGWRTKDRESPGPKSPKQVMTVPKDEEVQTFIADYLNLARYVIANPTLDGKRIWFVKQKHRLDQTLESIQESDFPVVSKHCQSVEVQIWPHDCRPGLPTNKRARWKGPDFENIESNIKKKTKKLSRYRAANPDKPVWLIVHADGSTPATRIMDEHRDPILGCILATHANQPNQFDQVWWMEDAISAKDAKLTRVV